MKPEIFTLDLKRRDLRSMIEYWTVMHDRAAQHIDEYSKELAEVNASIRTMAPDIAE